MGVACVVPITQANPVRKSLQSVLPVRLPSPSHSTTIIACSVAIEVVLESASRAPINVLTAINRGVSHVSMAMYLIKQEGVIDKHLF